MAHVRDLVTRRRKHFRIIQRLPDNCRRTHYKAANRRGVCERQIYILCCSEQQRAISTDRSWIYITFCQPQIGGDPQQIPGRFNTCKKSQRT